MKRSTPTTNEQTTKRRKTKSSSSSKTTEISHEEKMRNTRKQVMDGLKDLLEFHMIQHFDQRMSTASFVKDFAKPFLNELHERFIEFRPELTTLMKEFRKKHIEEKRQSLQHTSFLERGVKSNLEFISDPALLSYILSYLSLDDLLLIRQSGRYMRQFIQQHNSKWIGNFNLVWPCTMVIEKDTWKKISMQSIPYE